MINKQTNERRRSIIIIKKETDTNNNNNNNINSNNGKKIQNLLTRHKTTGNQLTNKANFLLAEAPRLDQSEETVANHIIGPL